MNSTTYLSVCLSISLALSLSRSLSLSLSLNSASALASVPQPFATIPPSHRRAPERSRAHTQTHAHAQEQSCRLAPGLAKRVPASVCVFRLVSRVRETSWFLTTATINRKGSHWAAAGGRHPVRGLQLSSGPCFFFCRVRARTQQMARLRLAPAAVRPFEHHLHSPQARRQRRNLRVRLGVRVRVSPGCAQFRPPLTPGRA